MTSISDLQQLTAENERLTDAIGNFMRMQTRLQRERDSARAEVTRLQGELVAFLAELKATGR